MPNSKDLSVEHIVIMKSHRRPAPETVASIADSIQKIGLLFPIIVRTRRNKQTGNVENVLIDGGHRLAAYRYLGRGSIPAVVLPKKKLIGYLATRSANLHRSELRALERAKVAVEYVEAAARVGGWKKKPRLSVDGKTGEALRRALSRYRKIAAISNAAQRAAVEAGLDDNQQALLRIAEKDGETAQLHAVRDITAEAQRPRPERPVPSADKKTGSTVDAPDVKSAAKSEPISLARSWKRSKLFRQAWKRASSDERSAFAEETLKLDLAESDW